MTKPTPNFIDIAQRFNLRGLPRQLSEIFMQPKDVSEIDRTPTMVKTVAAAKDVIAGQKTGLLTTTKAKMDVVALLEQVHRETLHDIIVKGQLFTKDGVDVTDTIRNACEQELVKIEAIRMTLSRMDEQDAQKGPR